MATPEEIAAQNSANGQSASGNGDATDYKVLYETTQAKLSLTEAEWQKRHGNLQTTFQEEQKAHKLASSELLTIKQQLEQTSKGYEALSGEKTTLQTQLAEKESAISLKDAALARKNLIMKEYPNLISFEVNGLLPEAPLDQLPERLGKFAESLQTVEKMAKENHQAGATPPAPASKENTGRTSATAMKDANSAALKGDQKSYQEFFSEYLTLSAKGK